MNTILLLMSIIISGVMTADQIGPNKETKIIKKEQESVTLSCSYETSSSYVRLYWYRQYPNTEPQYILYKPARSAGGGGNSDPQRFSSTTSQTSTELIINSVTLSDSALYFCALRVGGHSGRLGYSLGVPLTFGDPIRLTVIPKDVPNTPPLLSVLSPVNGKGPDICLAAGFFPRDKKMILNDDIEKSLDTSNAALFLTDKKYYYAGFEKETKDITKCKVDEKEATKTPDNVVGTADEPPKKKTPLICSPSASNISVSTDTGDPKMNSITLLMTGLRILLAKCVAVNVLMSVKALII